MPDTIFLLYLAGINLLALILMGADKSRSRCGKWRISEKVLFLVAVLGGCPGAIVGMYLFRHKTKHLRFVLGLPIVLLLQLCLILYLTRIC